MTERRTLSSASVEPSDREQPEAAADILVVDDDPANLAAMEAALADLGRPVHRARSGREALRRLLDRDFALILLDVLMPGLDGFETARLIRARRRSRHVPIIFVTAYTRDDADILKGYALGAVDFLFKPIVPEVLRAKASVFVELRERTAEVQRQAEQLRELERRESERKLAAERQRWEADALREESRRKDRFLAVLAHELRNPLAPMVTGLELIRHYAEGHSELAPVRESMLRQVNHLVRLVDDLLDVSRISQGKISLRHEALELAEVCHQAVDGVRTLLEERRHNLMIEGDQEPLVLVGDAVRLTQVVANLLHNAIRYTDPGGIIELSWRREGDRAVVRVVDNGRGITADMLPRIFDMFVQEREGGKGLGLGLTLVRQLVELHGGEVEADSAGRGQGSTFVVRLPLGAAAATAAPPGRTDEDGVPAAGLSVVVVEDEKDIRDALAALLERWGHRVESAGDGQEGLDLILDRRPDVALVDIAMPRLDGYELARAVRAALGDRGPRLVALTGFGQAEDRERATAAGFDHHLVKPANPWDLKRVLRRDSDGGGDGSSHGEAP